MRAMQSQIPNRNRFAQPCAAARRFAAGFTIIELLVVITVISVLVALVLPAVLSTRAASRRVQCQSNLRNVGLAMVNAAESARRFPASGNWGHHLQGDYNPYHSWVVDLLPWIDRRDLFVQWKFDESCLSDTNQALGAHHVAVLACPGDITVLGRGDQSYVVNGGIGYTVGYKGVGDCPVNAEGTPVDLNGNGVICPADPALDGAPSDRELFVRLGMFFAQNWRPTQAAVFHTLNDVTDGLSQTVLIAENVRTGADPYNPRINWASPVAFHTSFFLPPEVCAGGSCAAGNVDYARANHGSHAINAGLTQAEGESPWPSSYHTGGVFMAFGDGHVKFISQGVDGRVYAALLSPRGSRIEGPLAQPVLSGGDY
jgi:prepilin-type N-terminal cleavage/methylation domain-containing protein